MRLLVDRQITDSGMSAPAAILLHNIEDPLRVTPLRALGTRKARGLVLDAVECVKPSGHVAIRLHSLDDCESVPFDLQYFIADEDLHLGRQSAPGANCSAGDLIYGVRFLDCRETFEMLTIFGQRIVDMPQFKVLRTSRAILVSVFGGTTNSSNTLIARSVVDLVRTNTTVTDIESCDTYALDL